MIEHLLSHWLGLGHLLMALAALAIGAVVIFRRKGDRKHRWTGRVYLVAMLAMNVSAMMNYELYGHFGPFHWLALLSLATLWGGFIAARRKSPNWKYPHAYMMTGSYVGLVAAAVAEVASRVPGWSFGPSVIISSAMVIVVGIALMLKLIPRIL